MISDCAACIRLTMKDCGFRGKNVASECVLFHPTKRSIQREKDQAKKARMKPWLYMSEPPAMFDPRLRALVNQGVASALKCPVCGERDRKNTMNGRPWCMSCSVELLPAGKVDRWKRGPRIKLVPQ